MDEAITQAEAERDAGACWCATAGPLTDTRSLDDHHDLPRIIRAEGMSRVPSDTSRTTPSRWTSGSYPMPSPSRPAEGWLGQNSSETGSTFGGDLTPLWSDDVLVAAVAAAHAEGARVTAHVFGEDAVPGLITPASTALSMAPA